MREEFSKKPMVFFIFIFVYCKKGEENKSAYFLIYLSEKNLYSNATIPAEFSDILGLNSASNNLLANGKTNSNSEKKIYYEYMKLIPTTLKKEV